MHVYIANKRVKITASKAIGKGGEADIYALDNQKALKLFKSPKHPDFLPFPDLQKEAAKRIDMHQNKLPVFPKNLPERIIVPIDFAMDKKGKILGYTMKLLENSQVLLRYSEKNFRQHGVGAQTVISIFCDLHTTILKLHNANVIIGDFNDLNVLVHDKSAYVIDADSFQFGSFLCNVYTERFVDPLLCDKKATRPIPIKPFSKESDWYAYTTMLFRSLLLVDPYGGVYKPKKSSLHIPHCARSLHGITVFDSHVKYPKPAYRYDILPDELLQHFHQVFTHNKRCIFPRNLLKLNWKKCSTCSVEHAHARCPVCVKSMPLPVKVHIKICDAITVQKIVETAGPIVCATTNNGKLCYLFYDKGAFFREGKQQLFTGHLQPNMRFRLLRDKTLIACGNQLLILSQDNHSRLQIDVCDGKPVFDSNGSTYFWVQDDKLLRADPFGEERIGDVLSGQTHLWVGSDLGFGFYRAGTLQVGFTFDPKSRGINDNVKLPAISGQLVSVACKFAQKYCWFIWSAKEKGRIIYHTIVIQANGNIVASASAETWMESAHGALAIGSFLLVPTDEGIVRIEIKQGQIALTKTFANTEPYIDAQSLILPASKGIYALQDRTIHLLKMK